MFNCKCKSDASLNIFFNLLSIYYGRENKSIPNRNLLRMPLPQKTSLLFVYVW